MLKKVYPTYFDGVDNSGTFLGHRVEVDGAICGQNDQLILPGSAGMKSNLLDVDVLF
jgi:hypothetical protein